MYHAMHEITSKLELLSRVRQPVHQVLILFPQCLDVYTRVCSTNEAKIIYTTLQKIMYFLENISCPSKIWGFHDSDYEECRLLGYKTPVHTLRKHITSPIQSSAM
jgi:hypothetical protein